MPNNEGCFFMLDTLRVATCDVTAVLYYRTCKSWLAVVTTSLY